MALIICWPFVGETGPLCATSVCGMRRGGSAGNATAAGHRPSRVERVPGPPSGGKSGVDGATPSSAPTGRGSNPLSSHKFWQGLRESVDRTLKIILSAHGASPPRPRARAKTMTAPRAAASTRAGISRLGQSVGGSWRHPPLDRPGREPGTGAAASSATRSPAAGLRERTRPAPVSAAGGERE